MKWMAERCIRWCLVMFGRKLHFRNIIPNDFGNTVKKLVISWFFGFRPFFKMFLVDLMSYIWVRVMIWSVQNTTNSFIGLYFLKSFIFFVRFIVTKDTNIPINGTRLWAGSNSTVLIGAHCTTFSADIDGNGMLVSVRLTATSVVNQLDITSLYLIQRSILIL